MSDTVSRAERPTLSAEAIPLVVHPLVWAIQLWVVASVLSLLLSVGLSRALRGALVGIESWIIRVDHSAALTSQVAVICTALLLIYMGMLNTRASRSFLLGVGASLLGAAPTVIVFFAHQVALPHAHNWISALCASGCLVLCATQARTGTIMRTIVALASLSLFGAALRSGGLSGQGSELSSQVGQVLEVFFAWCTLGAALAYHLWSRRGESLRGPLILGGAALIAASVRAAREPEVTNWVLLLGRSVSELSPIRVMGPCAPYAFSCALLLVLSTLLSRPGSLSQLICALVALALVVPASPIVIAWLTLCGYCCVVICWVPDTDVQSSVESRAPA